MTSISKVDFVRCKDCIYFVEEYSDWSGFCLKCGREVQETELACDDFEGEE
jgi:hypothetical protein